MPQANVDCRVLGHQADLAIRGRAPSQPELTTVCTIEVDNVVHVSKALAARLGQKPKLGELPWIAWAPPYQTVPPQHVAAAEAGVGAVVPLNVDLGPWARSTMHLVWAKSALDIPRSHRTPTVQATPGCWCRRVRRDGIST